MTLKIVVNADDGGGAQKTAKILRTSCMEAPFLTAIESDRRYRRMQWAMGMQLQWRDYTRPCECMIHAWLEGRWSTVD